MALNYMAGMNVLSPREAARDWMSVAFCILDFLNNLIIMFILMILTVFLIIISSKSSNSNNSTTATLIS